MGGANILFLFKKNLTLACIIFVAACSGEEQTTHNVEGVNPAEYDMPALSLLVKEGDSDKALKIIKSREQLGLAQSSEYLLLADIYIKQGIGIAAEAAIDKARKLGVDKRSSALKMVKALMLRLAYGDAKKELATVSLSGKDGFDALLIFGEIARFEKNYAEAEKYFSIAAEEQPENHVIDNAFAFMALDQGDFDKAAKYAENAQRKNSEDFTAKYILAIVARYNSAFAEAEALLSEVLEATPKHYSAQIEYTGVLLDLEKYDEAEASLDALVQTVPNNPMVQYYLAFLSAKNDDNEAASEILLRLSELRRVYFPAQKLYAHVTYQLERYDMSNSLLSRVLEIEPTDKVSRLALVDGLRKVSKYAAALQILEPLLEQENEPDAAIEVQAGAINAQLGNIEAATMHYAKASQLTQNLPNASDEVLENVVESQALVEYAAGNHKEAISLLKNYSSNAKPSIRLLTTMANMQMETGDASAALATVNVLKDHPEGELVAANLEGAIEYRQKNYVAAIQVLTIALNKAPNFASALKNRAAAYMAQNNFKDAEKDLSHLTKFAAEDGQVFGMLGRSQMELGQYKEAVRSLAKARELIPNSAVFAINYARSLGGAGQYSDALIQAKEAKAMVKNNKVVEDFLNTLIREYTDRADFKN